MMEESDSELESNRSLQAQMQQKELQTTKKMLKECQAKFNLLNTDNAKLQNHNQILEQSLKKSEQKFKEVIEKLSIEQVKTKELAYLNKTLSVDVERNSHEKQDSLQKVQGNFTKLKTQFQDIQGVWERQKSTMHDLVHQCTVLLSPQHNKHLYGEAFPQASQTISEVVVRQLEKVTQILDCQSSVKSLQYDDGAEMMTNMKTKLFELEQQVNVLRKQRLDLSGELESANQQIHSLLPKYKEQIDKLQQQLRQGVSQQEEQLQDEVNLQARKFEQEKDSLKNTIYKLESQLKDASHNNNNKMKKSSSSLERQRDQNKSGKKIKKEIQQLDDDIVRLQKSLEQEMGKVGML